jgi:hypothetical protein
MAAVDDFEELLVAVAVVAAEAVLLERGRAGLHDGVLLADQLVDAMLICCSRSRGTAQGPAALTRAVSFHPPAGPIRTRGGD